MQRVVIDTNVLVSALIQRPYPYHIISNIIEDRNMQWCISEMTFQEYQSVLTRARFSRYPGFISKAELLLASVETIAIMIKPEIRLKIINDDGDNRFLELALESKADFLITGNTADFTMANYKQTRIVSPRIFWEEYGSGKR